MSSLPTAPIRTLTLGVAEPHPLTPEVIRRASAILSVAQQRLRARGYEVQTLRLSTRPCVSMIWQTGQIRPSSITHKIYRRCWMR